MRMLLTIIVLIASCCFDVEASLAYGDAPWCAVYGDRDANWDCQYRTVEECVPHILAGNRGFCNPNPSWLAPQCRRAHVCDYQGRCHWQQICD